MIAIIDGGLGNIGSVANMLRKLGLEHTVTADPDVVGGASRIVLPGVGAFDRGSEALSRLGLGPVIVERAASGTPVLGICLGMQLLARRSEEGELPGLGLVPADVVRIEVPEGEVLAVPHMGWNLAIAARSNDLVPSEPVPRYYFVHSYHMVCDEPSDVVAVVRYGADLTAAVERGNVAGVQFHPEKSHAFGMALLSAWAARPLTGEG